MKKVAIITWSKEEELIATKEYQHHPLLKPWLEKQAKFQAADSRIIFPEEQLLISSLAKAGIEAETVSWKDPSIDFANYDLCIVKTVWLWHVNPEAFFNFAAAISVKTPLWNPAELMRWGASKKYLLELAEKNIAIIPSLLIPANSTIQLEQVVTKNHWTDFIIKPSMSQGARNIIRVSMQNKPGYKTLEQVEPILKQILSTQDVVIQPYLNSIESEGEVSVITINGKVTHAIRRLPGADDFLAIGYPLTKEEVYPLSEEILSLSQDILQKVNNKMKFGRLDLIKGADGKFLLSEIELIAPRLFLQYSDKAVNSLVAAIKEAVSH